MVVDCGGLLWGAKHPELSHACRTDERMLRWLIIGMGWPMKDGSAPEEVRAPAYDDVSLFLACSFPPFNEVSSTDFVPLVTRQLQ